MSDADTVAPILTEIAAALRVFQPLVKGLRYTLAASDLSDAARSTVLEVFATVDARRTALLARQTALLALADGLDLLYTPIPPTTVSRAVFAELQQNLAAGWAAIGVLEAAPA